MRTPKCLFKGEFDGIGIAALVDDGIRIVACGIAPEKWWCNCGFQARRSDPVGPLEVCTHLWALGSIKREGQPGPIPPEAI